VLSNGGLSDAAAIYLMTNDTVTVSPGIDSTVPSDGDDRPGGAGG
jgi:hypothetical protein